MNNENTLSRALQDLSEVPGPDSLADKALMRAKKTRIKGYAISTVGAFVAAAVIAAPFLLTPRGGQEQGGGQFAAGPAPSASASASASAWPTGGRSPSVVNNGEPCETAPSVIGMKKVLPPDWPDYVKATIDRLPARRDYVMQSGTVGMCSGEAYSVINLGEGREAGHITIRLSIQPYENMPTDCSQVRPPQVDPGVPPAPHPFRVIFCAEGAGFRLVYGVDDGYNSYRVHAIYPDGRMVTMESIHDGTDTKPPTITAEELRVVVIDLAMLNFIK